MITDRSRQLKFIDLGALRYKEAWDLQERLFAEAVNDKIALRKAENSKQFTLNRLLFVEHPPVYTLGKSGKQENLLLDEAGLAQRGIDYYKINRGGDITFHGPGQLVGYPLLDLDQFFTDIHLYLRTLEEAVILTLAGYGISAGRIDGLTGVWIDYENELLARKICALGVKCSRWVTMHGFAFNVNTDLGYFGHIIPCGIDDKAVTSLAAELGYTVPLQEVKDKLRGHLLDLFGWEEAA